MTAWDRREEPREELAGRVTLGDPMEIDLSGFEAIVVSPGVPLNTHPLVPRARAAGVPIIGDIELFAQARADLPPHKVVGITGTNGKSTTTALVTHILTQAGVPALMGGNIGLPILAQEPLPEGGVYVLELSSYQIDLTFTLDCDVAVLLNVTPDHLDRYDGFEAYAASQGATVRDAVAGQNSRPRSLPMTPPTSSRRGSMACMTRPVCWLDRPAISRKSGRLAHAARPAQSGKRPVRAQCLRSPWADAGANRSTASRTYPGLPHRMERVATSKGILFINDSKATNPASTAPALAAWPPQGDGRKRLHWICGGLPKEDNLDDCAPNFGNVARAYTIGEAGPLFADLLEPHMPVERCELLPEAVRRAVENAREGDVVMLSPACASFDQFRDYEVRGDTFRELVAELGCGGDRATCGLAARDEA